MGHINSKRRKVDDRKVYNKNEFYLTVFDDSGNLFT